MPDMPMRVHLGRLTAVALVLSPLLVTPKIEAQELYSEPRPTPLIAAEWSFDQHWAGVPIPEVELHSFAAFGLEAQRDSTDWPIGQAFTGAIIGASAVFLVQATRCRGDCFVFWPPLSWVGAGGVGGFVLGALIGASMSD